MIDVILHSFNYVFSDPFFWPAMAFTSMVGIFIGAVIYDGSLGEVRKMILSLFCYASLILSVNFTRALPDVAVVASPYKPIAFIVATSIVTIFYLLGTFIGVYLVKSAHKE